MKDNPKWLKKRSNLMVVLLASLLSGFCLIIIAFTLLSSGLTLWFATNKTVNLSSAAARSTVKLVAFSTPTPSATPQSFSGVTTTSIKSIELSPTPAPATNTPTPTPLPTATPTLTLTPSPTHTPPETATPFPSPTPLPTSTPLPPPPDFPFVVQETESYATTHLNFDVYIAITDANNKPLPGYRVIGNHSSGLQIESQPSANDWTVNSGARQYKGGNLKYETFNSPGGVWTLQLVDETGQPVAPALEFPFDPVNPSWYFILYQLR